MRSVVRYHFTTAYQFDSASLKINNNFQETQEFLLLLVLRVRGEDVCALSFQGSVIATHFTQIIQERLIHTVL